MRDRLLGAAGTDDGNATRRILGGAFWNLLGRGLPLIVALVLTPPLVSALGIERWGLFTLALGLVGMFGVFDLGVGAALTRTIADRIGRGEREGEEALIASALVFLLAVSAALAAGLWGAVPWLIGQALAVPPALQAEAIAGFRALAAAAPLVVANAALWGVLAAHGRFRAANLATMPVAVLYYLGPLLVLAVWDSLAGVMLALVGARLLNTLSYLWLTRDLVPLAAFRRTRLVAVVPLLRLGGWLSLSGVLTQASLYLDRFLIGAFLSLAAVAFYATPLDLAMRLWILPVAVAQALMPALASSFRARAEETARLTRRAVLLVGALVLPGSIVLSGGAETLLRLWLGPAFAEGGATVLRILAVGILFSCASFAPGSLLEAIGRPDVTARLQVLVALASIPLLLLLLRLGGIEGAALAWALRCAGEWAGRTVLAARLYPAAARGLRVSAAPLVASGTALGLAPAVAGAGQAALLALSVLLFVTFGLRALEAEERAALRRPMHLLRTMR
ncbi:MAG: flippase [Acetobacteraceae bacterium]|nr:flippase [Acetobacteraceae bacterium]